MREIFPIVVVLFVLLIIAAAVTTVMVLMTPDQDVETVLIFEATLQSEGDATLVDTEAVAKAVERRVNPGYSSNALVNTLDDRQIRIGAFTADPEQLKRIRQLLETTGKIEFCILANRSEHEELINQANQDPGLAELTLPGRGVQARWLPIRAGREIVFRNSPGIVSRPKQVGNRTTNEVMVIANGFDSVNERIESAKTISQGPGQFSVELTLTPDGTELFTTLIGDETFTQMAYYGQDPDRRVGVVVDGALISAMPFEYPNYNRVQISGSFTKEEVDLLADVLNSGPLPARLKQVEVRQGTPQ